jgi:hypothetical protein
LRDWSVLARFIVVKTAALLGNRVAHSTQA